MNNAFHYNHPVFPPSQRMPPTHYAVCLTVLVHEFDYDHDNQTASMIGYEPIHGDFSVKIVAMLQLFNRVVDGLSDGPFAVFAFGTLRPNFLLSPNADEPHLTLMTTLLSRLPYIPQLPPLLQRLIEPKLGNKRLRPGPERGYMIVE